MALTAVQRRRRASRRFTPFKQPTRPPAGMYDPALDSGERAAGRGYGDLRQDTERDIGRTQDDLGIGAGNVEQNRTRQLADLMKARSREGEDYGFRTSELGRQFGIRTRREGDAANAAGIAGASGADSLGASNRAADQSREQGQLDLAHQRTLADLATSETRVGEDAGDQLGRMNLSGGRRIEDLRTGEERAGRELGFYGQDVNAQRFFQAGQAGYVPPTQPANEGTRYGVTYQRQSGGRALLPSGRMVSGGGLRNILRRAAQRKGVAYR